MWRRWTLYSFLFLSCGPTPDLISSSGVAFYFEGPLWSQAEVDEQEAWFLAKLPKGYENARNSMSRVEVEVLLTSFPCQMSPTGFCAGQQNFSQITVVDKGCPFNSAYTHEIAHWLQQDLHRFTDYVHEESDLWLVADSNPRSCD